MKAILLICTLGCLLHSILSAPQWPGYGSGGYGFAPWAGYGSYASSSASAVASSNAYNYQGYGRPGYGFGSPGQGIGYGNYGGGYQQQFNQYQYNQAFGNQAFGNGFGYPFGYGK